MFVVDESELEHSGTPHAGSVPHSGRYKWGSGENPGQHDNSFRTQYRNFKKQGFTEAEIVKAMGLKSTAELRVLNKVNREQEGFEQTQRARKLIEENGYSLSAAARKVGLSESTLRSRLKSSFEERASRTSKAASYLQEQVDKGALVDVGEGSWTYLGVSKAVLDAAVRKLKDQGYSVETIEVPQVSDPDHMTKIKVLAPKGMAWKDIQANKNKIQVIDHSFDESPLISKSDKTLPESVSSKRVKVVFDEEGGTQRDGNILVRPGVEDVALGGNHYAQVRIAVDGTHYLKGTAMYGDPKDFPPGVDLIFNSNKPRSVGKLGALKELKTDKDGKIDQNLPFGAVTRKLTYTDKNGQEHISKINLVREEGEWDTWSRNLPSQMLSKQSRELAHRQLGIAYERSFSEYQDILKLSNPAVKRKLLQEFSDECDRKAVDLKAAAMPRQSTHVILPIPSLKDNEIYAPSFRNGERVALIRFPHGGTFEIPELIVNNNNREARQRLGNGKGMSLDAVGINHKVAARLSGADFDGDTVLVIPNNRGEIKSTNPLKGLEDFDPSSAYPAYPGMKKVKTDKAFNKQAEMGKVSNLITDMTIKGATPDKIARAVRHSMVVIDAEKHNLDWRKSYEDNGIADLKREYQGTAPNGQLRGASTLISRASATQYVNAREKNPARYGGSIDPDTGKIWYRETGKGSTEVAYRDPTKPGKRPGSPGRKTWASERKFHALVKKGEIPESTKIIDTRFKPRLQESKKMLEVDDAFELSSGTNMEWEYATYANRMKALANDARKALLATPNAPYSPSAHKAYAEEVASLKAKLNTALKNKPLERKAQLIAGNIVRSQRISNPDLDEDELKKLRTTALETARARTGALNAEGKRVAFTPREWEAVQAGAISHTMLTELLKNADSGVVKELATPHSDKGKMNNVLIARARALLNAGNMTQNEVADLLGVSVNTLKANLNPKSKLNQER